MHFPPGPARVDIRLHNSTFIRRVTVPDDGRELHIVIPEGFLSVRVTNAVTNNPVGGATITWNGGGGRVEARATGNGDALLDGVGTGEGTLSISEAGYEPGEMKVAEPPPAVLEVALTPSPRSFIEARVTTKAGRPVANAVVELSPASPLEIGHIAVTDAKGVVTFSDVPPGTLQLSASAEGFASTAMRVAEDKRADVVLVLSRAQ
jgi:hypothetical protein